MFKMEKAVDTILTLYPHTEFEINWTILTAELSILDRDRRTDPND